LAAVDWRLGARQDREAIKSYIARDSPDYAPVFVARIHDAAERLRLFPRMGRIVPEFQSPELREILFDNYRLVYRIDGDQPS